MNNFKQLQLRSQTFLAHYIDQLAFSNLQQAMSYSLLASGKRVRPILVYLTGQMFGCELTKLDEAAAAIEAIHTYSLIHDDLPAMDNDNLRRGLASCHVKFGEAEAILAGDALQALAFSLLSESQWLDDKTKMTMVKELAQSSGLAGMCLGQSLDLQAEQQYITVEHLQKIHQHKTGALMRSAVRFGAFASGDIAKPYYSELDSYAESMGLAFQIQDDILDIIGEQSIMGKPKGSDLVHEKSTYPALLGLENAQKMAEQLYQQAIDSLAKIPYNGDALRDLADFIIHRKN